VKVTGGDQGRGGALDAASRGEASMGMGAGLPSGGRGRSGGSRLSRPAASLLLLVVVLVLWSLASEAELLDPIIVPPPSDIYDGLRQLLTSTFLLPHLWATTYETILGFLGAAAASVVLAVVLSSFAFVRDVVYPYLVVLQILPKVALAPIFIAWLGFGASSKITMGAAIAFFPMLINTMVGLESASAGSVLLMRSLVASRWQMFSRLTLPSALPYVFAGLKTSLTLALIGAVVAEFEGAESGLAVLLKSYSFQFQMGLVYAVLLILSLLGLVLYGLIELVERRVCFWKESAPS
jgi:NitT/TauT family transport system permease protein